MTNNKIQGQPIEILLVEDSPSDAGLTQHALKRGRVRNNLHHVEDGVAAMEFLRREPPYTNAPRPDIILLDLNMPRKDGREVLAELLNDDNLRTIPVVVLTTSDAEEDVLTAYNRKASCYIRKPVDMKQFIEAMSLFDQFWLTWVRLPENGHSK
ncbi:MAG: response regulator [Planctomycetaceae bacterium]|nr:response regulator [Planctomycetaceae bacterium]